MFKRLFSLRGREIQKKGMAEDAALPQDSAFLQALQSEESYFDEVQRQILDEAIAYLGGRSSQVLLETRTERTRILAVPSVYAGQGHDELILVSKELFDNAFLMNREHSREEPLTAPPLREPVAAAQTAREDRLRSSSGCDLLYEKAVPFH